jgi:hypothetical protein
MRYPGCRRNFGTPITETPNERERKEKTESQNLLLQDIHRLLQIFNGFLNIFLHVLPGGFAVITQFFNSGNKCIPLFLEIFQL